MAREKWKWRHNTTSGCLLILRLCFGIRWIWRSFSFTTFSKAILDDKRFTKYLIECAFFIFEMVFSVYLKIFNHFRVYVTPDSFFNNWLHISIHLERATRLVPRFKRFHRLVSLHKAHGQLFSGRPFIPRRKKSHHQDDRKWNVLLFKSINKKYHEWENYMFYTEIPGNFRHHISAICNRFSLNTCPFSRKWIQANKHKKKLLRTVVAN